MGSHFELVAASLLIDSGKGYLPDYAMVPFQAADRRDVHDADGDVRRHVYVAPAEVVGRRLDLLGFSLAAARRAFHTGLERLGHSDISWPSHLTGENAFPTWLSYMREILDAARRLEHIDARSIPDENLKFMLTWHEDHMFGFPNGDPRLVLRGAVTSGRPDDEIVLDFDDLVTDEYVTDDDTLWQLSREPLIVVTEGKSDARLLSRSLRVLLPRYCDFMTFIDFETANARGGIDELVQFVRMVVGCGIKNRMVVLFDNDTAGVDALQRLQEGAVPSNVFPMTLPSSTLAVSYPTLGPDGKAFANINGKAASLELFLGADSLSIDGELSPVRWTGFNDRLDCYQGQISNKGRIQRHFEEKLDRVKSDAASLEHCDFSGIQAIFKAIFDTVGSR